jgi:hypothetical protein
MEDPNAQDRVDARDLHDMFFKYISSQPDEALRYFRTFSDKVKELQEEQSEVYQQAKQFFDRCIHELLRISPILPEIVQGCIDGRDESWFKERCVGLDERIVHALFDYMRE